jgi:VanZ family protein
MIPFATCLEFVQTLVPGRSAEIRNVIANISGVLTGLLVALVVETAIREK